MSARRNTQYDGNSCSIPNLACGGQGSEALCGQSSLSLIVSYGVAVLAVVVALLLTLFFQIELKRMTFVFFLIAVIVSTWCGDFGPGLLAMALATLPLFSQQFDNAYSSYRKNKWHCLVFPCLTKWSCFVLEREKHFSAQSLSAYLCEGMNLATSYE